MAKKVFNKILQTHSCVHIHPNNCCPINSRLGIDIPMVAEFTFLRNDRFMPTNYETIFPNELDFDNVKDKKSLFLSKIWYRNS